MEKNANMVIRGMGKPERRGFFCKVLYRMMTEAYVSQREDRNEK
jgi:hypothetical protein